MSSSQRIAHKPLIVCVGVLLAAALVVLLLAPPVLGHHRPNHDRGGGSGGGGGGGGTPPPAQVSCGDVLTASVTVQNDLLDCPGDGLMVGADGITVDLNGRTVDGVGLGVGLRNDGFDRVTIRNGTVQGFDYGVRLGAGTVSNSVTGVSARDDEFAGVQLVDADSNQVTQSQASGFSGAGIHLTSGSSSNTVAGNAVSGGAGASVVLDQASNSNRVEDNEVRASSNAGVLVDSSEVNTVTRNRVSGSGDAGIELRAASHGNELLGNVVELSSDSGLLIAHSDSSLVRDNTLVANAQGIELDNSELTRLESNVARANGGYGIELSQSPRTTLVSNIASSNQSAGVFLDGTSFDSTLDGNTASENSDNGIEVNAAGTVVSRNTANNNNKFGIYAVEGVLDGGGNRASGNAEAAQCFNISCS